MKNALIGNLRVSLGLDSAEFRTEVDNVQSSMSRFGKQMAGLMAGAGAVVTGAFAAMTFAAKRADDQFKVAQGLGVSIESLGRLSHAANMSGASYEGLQTAIKKASQATSKAAQGAADASTKAFKAIGVSLVSADGSARDMTDVMSDVAAVFEKMPNGANKTSLAMALFGKTGAQLIPMLNAGRAGLKDMGDEAERLGLVFDERTARAAERFNDNMSRLSGSMTGMWNKTLKSVIGGMDVLTQRFVDASQSGGLLDTVASALAWTMNAAARGIRLVLDNLDPLITMAKTYIALQVGQHVFMIANAFLRYARIVRVAALATAAFNAITKRKLVLLAVLGAVILEKFDLYNDLTEKVRAVSEAVMSMMPDEIIDGIGSFKQAMKDLGSEIDNAGLNEIFIQNTKDIATGFLGAGAAAKKMSDEAARVFERTRTPLERFRAEMADLDRMLAKGAITQDTYNRAVAQAQEAFNQAEMAAESARGVMLRISQSISDSFSDAFAGLIDGSRRVQDVLRDLLSQFGRMATNSVFQQLFGMGSGWLGGLFGVRGLSSSTFSGWYADGGRIPSGGWGIAGEVGPEIVTGPAKVWTPDMLRSHVDTSRANDNGPSVIYLRLAPGLQADILEQSAQQSVRIVEEYDRTQAPSTARRAVGAANRQSSSPDFRRR